MNRLTAEAIVKVFSNPKCPTMRKMANRQPIIDPKVLKLYRCASILPEVFRSFLINLLKTGKIPPMKIEGIIKTKNTITILWEINKAYGKSTKGEMLNFIVFMPATSAGTVKADKPIPNSITAYSFKYLLVLSA
jgi:hypothetical protein